MNFKQAILWPLTLPYGAVNYLRGAAYRTGVLKAKRLHGVVVSVGNLTVGGTGKTPMVAVLAEHLLAEGKCVGILTRGYRGARPGTGSGARSDAGSSGGNATSDEVELLRARLGEKVEFGVGADRFARGQELERSGVEWFILDDGFQHLQLARDVNIVLVDALNPFGGGHLLPAGRLREPRSALSRADIVIVTRSERAPAGEAAVAHYTKAPMFYARTQLDFIQAITGGSSGRGLVAGAIAMEMRKCFVFCGIGNPAAFVADVRGWGFPVVGQKFFRDHHRYTQADVEAIEREASVAGARELLCTEKDRFNLGDVRWVPASNVSYCRISMRIDRETEFWNVLEATAKRKHVPNESPRRHPS